MKFFDYTDSFCFTDGDEKEIMEKISNGTKVETAVSSWACELDDCDYYKEDLVHDQIVAYIKEKIGE